MQQQHVQYFINIFLNVIFISIFIGIFFFTYGKTVEEHIIINQTQFIADELSKDISLFIDKPTAKIITDHITIPDETQLDNSINTQNSIIQRNAFHILLAILIFGMSTIFFISSFYNINLFPLIKHNLIILFFVGLTEYFFLTYITQNFILVDPNHVRYTILTSLKQQLH